MNGKKGTLLGNDGVNFARIYEINVCGVEEEKIYIYE